jgi:hypothetical protein
MSNENIIEGDWFDADVQKKVDYEAQTRGLDPVFRRDELKKGTMGEKK